MGTLEYLRYYRRHSLPGLITLIETHRVIDSDVGILKCNNGRLQIIEGDRIRNPPKDTRSDTYESAVFIKRLPRA